MRIEICAFRRGNESLAMIQLLRDRGGFRLREAKEAVEAFLRGDLEKIVFECSDMEGCPLVSRIEQIGFDACLARD